MGGLAGDDIAAHTPSHGLPVPHRWDVFCAPVSADRLGDTVGAFVGVNDRRITHPLTRCPQTVGFGQGMSEGRLIPGGTPLGDPEDLHPVDTISVHRRGTGEIPVKISRHGVEGLGFRPAGFHRLEEFTATGVLLLCAGSLWCGVTGHGSDLLDQARQSSNQVVLTVPTISRGISSCVQRRTRQVVREGRIPAQGGTQGGCGGFEQAHIRRFPGTVGVDRVDQPDQLCFAVGRVDPDPGRPGTDPGESGDGAVGLRVDVVDTATVGAVAIHVDDDDRGVLLVGQGNVLHPGQGGMSDSVHFRHAGTVSGGAPGFFEVAGGASLQGVSAQVSGEVGPVGVGGPAGLQGRRGGPQGLDEQSGSLSQGTAALR